MTWTASDTESRVVQLVASLLGLDVPDAETDLLQTGMIDSLGLLSLILELEDEFGCQLPLERVDLDDLRTVSRIAATVSEASVT